MTESDLSATERQLHLNRDSHNSCSRLKLISNLRAWNSELVCPYPGLSRLGRGRPLPDGEHSTVSSQAWEVVNIPAWRTGQGQAQMRTMSCPTSGSFQLRLARRHEARAFAETRAAALSILHLKRREKAMANFLSWETWPCSKQAKISLEASEKRKRKTSVTPAQRFSLRNGGRILPTCQNAETLATTRARQSQVCKKEAASASSCQIPALDWARDWCSARAPLS